MKKMFFLLVILAIPLVTVVACGSDVSNEEETSNNEEDTDNDAAAESDYPTDPVTFIVPYAAGGGTDLAARYLQPLLEEELGVPVVVENMDGGGGWVGWAEMAEAEPDGYTIGYMNMPNVIVGYVNPDAGREETLDSFDFLIKNSIDPGIIAVRADEDRFDNMEELVDYSKENEVTVNASGVGSANHVIQVMLQNQLDMNLQIIHTDGGAEAIPQVLGGHVDLYMSGIAEAVSPIENGELKPIAVFGAERADRLPDVPTVEEATGVSIGSMLSRPIGAPAGLEPHVYETLQNAIENAMNEPEYIAEIENMGLEVDYTKGEDLEQELKETEQNIIDMKSDFGW